MTDFIFKQLDNNEFKKRLSESFPAVYLTNVSIIQGVALGLLIYNFFQNAKHILHVTPFAITNFIFLLIVSYSYTWYLCIFRWIPKIWDTLIPLCIGITEIAPTYFLRDGDHLTWWIMVCVFLFMGILGFTNTFCRCNKKMYHRDYEPIFLDFQNDLIRCIGITFIGFILALTECILYYLNEKQYIQISVKLPLFNAYLHELWVILLIIILAIMLMKENEDSFKKMTEDFSVYDLNTKYKKRNRPRRVQTCKFYRRNRFAVCPIATESCKTRKKNSPVFHRAVSLKRNNTI